MAGEAGVARVGRVGMVARWKPVHLGHAAVLEGLLACADEAVIGIGSSNKYDADNPFTAAETAEMIRLVLGPASTGRYRLIEVPDLGDGPRWAKRLHEELFPPLDLFVTANAWVRDLLHEVWPIVHPVRLVPPERRVRVDGTLVRRAMASGGDWESLVPPAIAAFLKDRGLFERFVREFGPATLAKERGEP